MFVMEKKYRKPIKHGEFITQKAGGLYESILRLER